MAMRAASETSYREIRPPPRLGEDLVCSWVGRGGPEGPPAIDRVLSDGRVDVVWDGERLFVAGPRRDRRAAGAAAWVDDRRRPYEAGSGPSAVAGSREQRFTELFTDVTDGMVRAFGEMTQMCSPGTGVGTPLGWEAGCDNTTLA